MLNSHPKPIDRLAARLVGCECGSPLKSPQAGPLNGPARGFTLVELLTAVTVLAVVASIFLAALYSAQEQARTIKTRATIAKLHNIIMQRYDSYKTRRVPINVRQALLANDPKYSRKAARLRLDALRELMRFEMPDRLTDVISLTSPYAIVTPARIPVPSVTNAYHRKLKNAFSTKPPGNSSSDPSKFAYKNQSAELLYMIVMSAQAEDESQAENFGTSEVADTDGNGLPEFIDAWGTPIQWVRWPAGFISELQPVDPTTGNRDFAAHPDPFDPRKVYPTKSNDDPPSQTQQPFAIFPLIYSAGPDKIYDIFSNRELDDPNPPYSYGTVNNDPFATVADDPTIGEAIDRNSDQVGPANGEANWLDNIHNHLIGQR